MPSFTLCTLSKNKFISQEWNNDRGKFCEVEFSEGDSYGEALSAAKGFVAPKPGFKLYL
jgi:hypothetical protein